MVNAIPIGTRTAFRGDGEQDSGVNVTRDSDGKAMTRPLFAFAGILTHNVPSATRKC